MAKTHLPKISKMAKICCMTIEIKFTCYGTYALSSRRRECSWTKGMKHGEVNGARARGCRHRPAESDCEEHRAGSGSCNWYKCLARGRCISCCGTRGSVEPGVGDPWTSGGSSAHSREACNGRAVCTVACGRARREGCVAFVEQSKMSRSDRGNVGRMIRLKKPLLVVHELDTRGVEEADTCSAWTGHAPLI